ncbi:AGAP001511-PA-like protein [Anopheles sinensis]|uniref:AGAP001511-PA-like protein n=1 Tax=Anopheles sinensis TaxID=74873 RepID=A0A084W535_ANOSI|nr:AGAP001511-PA-like protein [Anopheles sinensis]
MTPMPYGIDDAKKASVHERTYERFRSIASIRHDGRLKAGRKQLRNRSELRRFEPQIIDFQGFAESTDKDRLFAIMLVLLCLTTVVLFGGDVAANGFNYNQYPQAQVNAWSQACRGFQAQALATQAAQNQFFTNTFPHIQLPPLPFMDLCSQPGFSSVGAAAGAGSFSHGGAGAAVGGTSFNNRFGGDDGGYGGSGGVQGVSISSSSNGLGQGGTTVTHFGGGGASTNYIPHGGNNGGGFSTANRFGGSSGQGVSVSSTYGTNGGGGGGGFVSANRFGGSSGGGGGGGTTHYVSTGNGGGTVSSFGPNGGSFASASRFGGSNGGGYSGGGGGGYGGNYGGGHGVAVGSSVSSTSHGNGGGSVQTSVYKQHY